VTVTWDPSAFTPISIGRQYRVTVQDLTVAGLTSRVVAAPATSTTLSLVDGHEYAIRMFAEERECVAPGVCADVHINGPTSETRVTRVDSAPPAVAVQINGGAPFTNDPSVVLESPPSTPRRRAAPRAG
jgi:hypothetical protein